MMATVSTALSQGIPKAKDLPRVTRKEAYQLAQAELDRLIGVIESLEGEDWSQPTDCTEWDVKAMVAHVAGAMAAYASFGEFRRQYLTNPYMKTANEPVDAVNRVQVSERADATPDELIAEIKAIGRIALNNRFRRLWMRQLPAPLGPVLGVRRMRYLFDLIYPRDQWMHRIDILRATNRNITFNEHDHRMNELMMIDAAEQVDSQLDRQVTLHLVGDLEASYAFGNGTNRTAEITVDFVDYHRYESGRIGLEELLPRTTINGDRDLADQYFEHSYILY